MRRSLSIRYHIGKTSRPRHHRPSIIERNAAFTSAGSPCSFSHAATVRPAIARIVGRNPVHALTQRGRAVHRRAPPRRRTSPAARRSRRRNCSRTSVLPCFLASAITSGMSSQMNCPPVSTVSPRPFGRASTRPPTRSRASSTVTSMPAASVRWPRQPAESGADHDDVMRRGISFLSPFTGRGCRRSRR